MYAGVEHQPRPRPRSTPTIGPPPTTYNKGLTLPPETNSADWVLDLTVHDGKALSEAYQQRKAGPLTVRDRERETEKKKKRGPASQRFHFLWWFFQVRAAGM